MKTMIQVGAERGAVIEARKAVLEIIETSNSEAVKIEALKTFQSICNVDNTTISGCTLTNKD